MSANQKDVLLYAKLMSLDHDIGNDDDVKAKLPDHIAINIDKQGQVSAPSAPSAEFDPFLSPESESLSTTESPVDKEGCQLDEASISSEATRDDTGLLP